MSNSLWSHGLHCPSLSPSPSLLKFRAVESVMLSNHLILSPPSPLGPQSFPELGSFAVNQLFTSGGQSIRALVSATVLPMNIQDWFPLGLTDMISLQSKGLSRVFSNTTVKKHQILRCSAFFMVQLSHPDMTTGKTMALNRWTFVGKVMSLFFNMLSRLD